MENSRILARGDWVWCVFDDFQVITEIFPIDPMSEFA